MEDRKILRLTKGTTSRRLFIEHLSKEMSVMLALKGGGPGGVSARIWTTQEMVPADVQRVGGGKSFMV